MNSLINMNNNEYILDSVIRKDIRNLIEKYWNIGFSYRFRNLKKMLQAFFNKKEEDYWINRKSLKINRKFKILISIVRLIIKYSINIHKKITNEKLGDLNKISSAQQIKLNKIYKLWKNKQLDN